MNFCVMELYLTCRGEIKFQQYILSSIYICSLFQFFCSCLLRSLMFILANIVVHTVEGMNGCAVEMHNR